MRAKTKGSDMNGKRYAALRATSALCLFAAAPALAQGTAASPSAPVASENGDQEDALFGEIVVTAQKRNENLQDVPVAVTAFTSEMRDLIGVETVQDMTLFTPGLTYNTSLDRLNLRGVGRYTNDFGSDPGVAVYNDGFYTSSTTSGSKSTIFNQRVEVLRRRRSGRGCIPAASFPLLIRDQAEILLVEMFWLPEHQVSLEVRVKLLRIACVLDDAGAKRSREPRQQNAVELPHVGVQRGLSKRPSFIQTPPHRQRRRLAIPIGPVQDRANAIQTRDDGRQRRHRVDRGALLECCEIGINVLEEFAIAGVAN